MKEDTLLDMVNHMSEKTGIVHQMPFTSDRNGFAATLEKVIIVIIFNMIWWNAILYIGIFWNCTISNVFGCWLS